MRHYTELPLLVVADTFERAEHWARVHQVHPKQWRWIGEQSHILGRKGNAVVVQVPADHPLYAEVARLLYAGDLAAGLGNSPTQRELMPWRYAP